MMPFKGFNSVYDTIRQAVEGIEGKEFRCERADDKYTNLSIWCNRICKNIRKAKYIIVDTTRRNPNVFYELGFAHAMYNTKAIIITQNIKEAPFDIAEINHIIYSEKELPGLREELKNAIQALEEEEIEEGYANKSTEEVITDLKSQLRAEEERAEKFKNELVESEERERKLKKSINEIASIQNNPDAEARNKIAELEGTIAGLKEKLERTEKDKKDTIEELTKTLKEKEGKLKILAESFDNYKGGKDVKSLSNLLLDDTRRRAEAEKWFNRAYDEDQKGNRENAIEYYTRAIELNPEYADAYNNRGNAYRNLKEYEKAISDYNRAIELNPEDADAYENLSELYITTGNYKSALETITEALSLSLEIEDRAVCLYLECIAKKMLQMDISDCEKEFNEIHKREFETTWSFAEIESWLENEDISNDQKAFIIEKTELLKEHKR